MKTKLEPLKLLKQYYHIPIILAILAIALWFRTGALRYTHIPDIDVYYFIRQSTILLNNNFILPLVDTLRTYPTNFFERDVPGTSYIPAMIYAIITKFATIDFISYVKWIPAIFGTMITIPIYFIGKSLKNRTTGLISAFIYATIPAVLFRTSAGEYEKEAFGLFFILVGIAYLITAYKEKSFMKSLLAATSILLGGMTWGGINQIYLFLGGIAGLYLLLNQDDKWWNRTYLTIVAFIFFGDVTNIAFGGTAAQINYMIAIALIVKQMLKKYKILSEEKLKYYGVGLASAGIIIGAIGSFFSKTIASTTTAIKSFLFFEHGIVGSTVAENAPGTFSHFSNMLGIGNSQSFNFNLLGMEIPANLGFMTPMLSAWVLASLGLLLMTHKSLKKDKTYWYGMFSTGIAIFTYLSVLSNKSNVLQSIFIISMIISTSLVLRKNATLGMMLFFTYTSFMTYISFIRMLIMVGTAIVFSAAYFADEIIQIVHKLMKVAKKRLWLQDNIPKQAMFITISILVALAGITTAIAHAESGYVLSRQLGPNYNDNWDEAMTFMREETPEDSVILSWWDFGYWFQLKGERASNLDGGNTYEDRNKATAQFFTGQMSEEEQKLYLQKFGSTHIIVDSSMVGKYSAMSTIANDGKKVEGYNIMQREGTYDREGTTLIAYRSGSMTLWVPVLPNGNIRGDILVQSSHGDTYVSNICTNEGIADLTIPEGKSFVRGCIIFTPSSAIFASLDVANSVFQKLFFMNGADLDYVEKVFDNSQIIIYEVKNIPRESREDLQKWWAENGVEALLVDKEEVSVK